MQMEADEMLEEAIETAKASGKAEALHAARLAAKYVYILSGYAEVKTKRRKIQHLPESTSIPSHANTVSEAQLSRDGPSADSIEVFSIPRCELVHLCFYFWSFSITFLQTLINSKRWSMFVFNSQSSRYLCSNHYYHSTMDTTVSETKSYSNFQVHLMTLTVNSCCLIYGCAQVDLRIVILMCSVTDHCAGTQISLIGLLHASQLFCYMSEHLIMCALCREEDIAISTEHTCLPRKESVERKSQSSSDAQVSILEIFYGTPKKAKRVC